MRIKKSAINKKINSQIKKPHLKMIPIEDIVSEFELQSSNYFHFQINTLGKSMNSLSP